MNRFDNILTADLLKREIEERRGLTELQEAVRQRLIDESGIEIGAVYRVTHGRFAGRRIWVEGVQAGIPDVLRRWPFETWAWGRLNGKSAAGDGWTIVRQNVGIGRLEMMPWKYIPAENGKPSFWQHSGGAEVHRTDKPKEFKVKIAGEWAPGFFKSPEGAMAHVEKTFNGH